MNDIYFTAYQTWLKQQAAYQLGLGSIGLGQAQQETWRTAQAIYQQQENLLAPYFRNFERGEREALDAMLDIELGL